MEKNNKGLIVLVAILSLLVVGLGGYFIYDKIIVVEEDNDKVVDNDDVNIEDNDNVDNNKDDIDENNNVVDNTAIDINNIAEDLSNRKSGYKFETKVGNFNIADGFVYYEPYKEFKQWGGIYSLDFSNASLGEKNTYIDFSSDMGNNYFNGYKLDLYDIKSGYEVYFGNGGVSDSIIFVDKNGRINELYFEFNYSSNTYALDVSLYKNVGDYKGIVSVVPYSGFNSSFALLIDKDGNEYKYYGAKNQ